MRPHLVLCAVVATVFVAGAAVAVPADALAEPALTLAASSVAAGGDIAVSGTGWETRQGDVRLQLDESDTGTPRGERVVSPVLADGQFSATVPVPPDAPPGPYRLLACQACDDVDSGAPFAQRELTVLAPALRLDPESGATGEQFTASGEGWSPERGPVLLFAAASAECVADSALASALPDESSAFTIAATVPALDPAEYRFMAAQCDGSKVVVRAFASFTITPVETTPTSSTATSDPVSPTSSIPTSGSPTSSAPAPPQPSPRHYGWLALLVVVAAVLAGLAFRLATRRPRRGGPPPQVSAEVGYRPAQPPAVHETPPTDRPDVRLLTDEQYGPVTSTEERR
jgi:hypothetical protein